MKQPREPAKLAKNLEVADWEEMSWRSLNDSLEAADTFNAERLIEEIDTIPKEARDRRIRELFYAYDSLVNSFITLTRAGRRIVLCLACRKFYNAARRTKECPICARRRRQQRWRQAYEKQHGHPYKQKREAAYMKKVRKALENQTDFESNRDLAGKLGITLKQCEVALATLNPSQKKRADPARKRR
jgi:hypothetical protein